MTMSRRARAFVTPLCVVAVAASIAVWKLASSESGEAPGEQSADAHATSPAGLEPSPTKKKPVTTRQVISAPALARAAEKKDQGSELQIAPEVPEQCRERWEWIASVDLATFESSLGRNPDEIVEACPSRRPISASRTRLPACRRSLSGRKASSSPSSPSDSARSRIAFRASGHDRQGPPGQDGRQLPGDQIREKRTVNTQGGRFDQRAKKRFSKP